MNKVRLLIVCCLVPALLLSGCSLRPPVAGPKYGQSPALKAMVERGALPPVEERLPEQPLVIPPHDETGEYGGVLRLYAPSPDLFDDLHWVRHSNWLRKDEHAYYTESESGFVPYRALSFTANDNFTEFHLVMRKGMKWSDGVPVTADDVLFAIEDVWLNEELDCWWYHWMSDNRPKVTRVNDFELIFTFEKPAPKFLKEHTDFASNQGVGLGETPSHYLKQFHIKYNKNADEEAVAVGFNDWVDRFKTMSECADPQSNLDLPTINAWMLKSKTTTQRVYTRNPYYWAVDDKGNQLPYIDGYVVSVVNDMDVARLKLITGEFDMAGVFLIQLNEYSLLKQNEQMGEYRILLCKRNVSAKPILAPNLNHSDPILRELFNEPDFRKALSYAINRDEINELSFAGLAEPMQNVYTVYDHIDPAPWLHAYTEFLPERAIELLNGLGLVKGEDGMYMRPDGQPLTIKLQTIEEEGWGNTVRLVARHWSDIGIETLYVPMERALWGELNNTGRLDFFIWQDSLLTEESAANGWGQWTWNEKAWDWYRWLESGGRDGEEPPSHVKETFELTLSMMAVEYGSEEYKIMFKQVWDYRVLEQLYVIGTVGNFPSPLLVKNSLGNVGNLENTFDFWQGQYPEQFYWKDAARRAEVLP